LTPVINEPSALSGADETLWDDALLFEKGHFKNTMALALWQSGQHIFEIDARIMLVQLG
jgi:hypothetical protein